MEPCPHALCMTRRATRSFAAEFPSSAYCRHAQSMVDVIGVALGLAVLVLVVGGLGTMVYFAVRGQGGTDNFSFRNLLRAYLRLAYLVSLVVFMIGAVMTLTAAFGTVVGHDFSYDSFYSH